MNESYALACADSSCTITAAETVGALRGLETLAHLAHSYAPGGCKPQPGGGQGRCGRPGGPLPMPLTLADSPRFPYRGLLIDSARECGRFVRLCGCVCVHVCVCVKERQCKPFIHGVSVNYPSIKGGALQGWPHPFLSPGWVSSSSL